MRIPESELIINADGSVFHLHMKPEQLAGIVFLVGDPGRVALFKALLDTVECEGASREFVFVTGLYGGVRVTCLSTGIGTDNIDIVMTELDALANIDFTTREVRPVHRTLAILRVGTCGTVSDDIPLGSFIYSEISIGCDGLLDWYASRDEVALPGFEEAFVRHMHWDKRLPAPYFVRSSRRLSEMFRDVAMPGMTISAPGFYGPQGRSVRLGLAMPDFVNDCATFSYDGHRITNIEMESSALAGLAAHFGHDAGTVCCAVAHRTRKDALPDYLPRMRNLVKLALDRMTSAYL